MTTAGFGPRLDGAGTPEAVWSGGPLEGLAQFSVGDHPRAVVLGPHPDDEVLGAGGLMQRLSSAGTQLTVVSVTDGEASHPHSPSVSPVALAHRRTDELRQALDLLGLSSATVLRLALPDGAAGHDVAAVETCLRGLLGPDVLCVAPWECDGHPDHDAAGRAAATACGATGAALVSYLVWTWHWAAPDDPRVPWARARRLDLSGVERSEKRSATAAFRSQTTALSDQPGDEAILGPEMLAHFARAHEVFLT